MGLRSFYARAKAAFSDAPYIEAISRLLEGYGSANSKPRPFNVEQSAKQFKHWAYAAAMLNANAKSNVPLRLFARSRPGLKSLYETRPLDGRMKKFLGGGYDSKPSRTVMHKVASLAGDLVEVVEPHPAITVLQKPNRFDNGYTLDVLRMIDLQVSGNSYNFVVTGPAGIPVEIWRMPPQYTTIIPSKTDFIDGYRYGIRPDDRTFAEADVDHFKMPNPNDIFYGMGWFEAAWSAIGLHDSKRHMDLAKFDNMARPDYLLSVKSGAKKEVIDKFADDVEKKFGGVRKSGKFLTVGADIDIKALNMDVPEVGTATRVIEEISAVSGVPVSMLLTNDSTRGAHEPAWVNWYRNTIRPYCRMDEEKLNERWLPRFEGSEDLVLSYDLVSFEDEESQAKRLIGLVSGGIITPNEGRSEMGYDKNDGPNANTLYPPSGLTAGAAATGADLGPGQNDSRQNEAAI